MTIDEEDYNELEKELDQEKENSQNLQKELDKAVNQLSESKVKYRKFLVGKQNL